MAIYHFSGTVISRSQGRSAVACAAYRSGELLHDERYDKNHDYTEKNDIAHTEILLPSHAPEWMRNREKLWNAVEAFEKRKDSQLAREFNFALPRELTIDQNIALARDFVKQEFVSKGMVADLCVHNDKMPSGEFQPHAHVMLTMRQVTPGGFGQKVREWNAKENLLLWREAWAEVANRHLFLHGHDIKIDHKTLDAQGIGLEPQHKIGSTVAKERLARLVDHQRIAKENGEKLLVDPSLVLSAVTRQQSTFTHQDLARFINRHTVDAEQFQAVYEKVKASAELVLLGRDDKQQERFTTQELLAIEKGMLSNAKMLSSRGAHGVKEHHKTQALSARSLTTEQQAAFSHLVGEGDLKNVVGYAGTGKSYLLGAAKEAWEAQGYNVLGATLSGIAAENLEAGSGIASRTLASRQYYWGRGKQLLTSNDILVVDEAGMIGSRQLAKVLEIAEQSQAKVVLVGDPYQLQAIEAGAAFRAISEQTPTLSITEIRRQTVAWQKEATMDLATGQTEAALHRYQQHDHLHAFGTQVEAKQSLVQLWNDVRVNHPEHSQIMLSYTRSDVRELNDLSRALRHAQGELGTDHQLTTARGDRAFAEQDRIYFLQNDRELGVKNGTLGTIQSIRDNMLTVQLDKSDEQHTARTLTFSTDRYNQIDHGYAATIHKSQGVTVDRTYLLASRYMDGHSTYVGLTRHRESADVFYSREEFVNDRSLTFTLGRERSKDVTLDYTEAFSQRRGFEETASSKASEFDKNFSTAEAQRYDQFFADAAKDYDRWAARSEATSLDEFKAQFEADHPKRAKMLRVELEGVSKPSQKPQALEISIPSHYQNKALEVEKQIEQLEYACEHSRTPKSSRDQLERYASGIAKNPEVMGYLEARNPKLVEKIENFAKSHEKVRELDREIDF